MSRCLWPRRESSAQAASLVSEVLGELLRDVSSAEIELERKRVAEEKRRLEEARLVMVWPPARMIERRTPCPPGRIHRMENHLDLPLVSIFLVNSHDLKCPHVRLIACVFLVSGGGRSARPSWCSSASLSAPRSSTKFWMRASRRRPPRKSSKALGS